MVERKELDHVLGEFSCFDNVVLCTERTSCSKNVEHRYCIEHNGNNFCMDYRFKGEAIIKTSTEKQLVRVTLPNMVAVADFVKRTRSAVLSYNQ